MLYDISFDIASLLIAAVILFVLTSQYTNQTKTNRLFRLFVISLFATIVLDITTAFTISYSADITGGMNFFLNTLYFYSTAITEYLVARYVMECVKRRFTKLNIVDLSLIGIYGALLVANLFTGIMFDFREGQYIHGPLYIVNFIMPLVFIVELLVITIYGRKELKKKQIVGNAILVCLAFTTTFLQMAIFSNMLLTYLGCTLGALIMMFSLETPDYKELEYLRQNLVDEVKKQTQTVIEKENKITELSFDIVRALAGAIDAKDEYTKGHSTRVALYSVLMAQKIGMEEDEVERLRYIALLHDIGKIGIPDNILKKPGRLTDEEYLVIKNHTMIGADILHNIKSFENADFIAQSHHERYDGTGYPNGLKAEKIPLMARIICIADSYDAMSSTRVYRPNLSHEKIRSELMGGRGTQFDPTLLDIFVEMYDRGELGKMYDG